MIMLGPIVQYKHLLVGQMFNPAFICSYFYYLDWMINYLSTTKLM